VAQECCEHFKYKSRHEVVLRVSSEADVQKTKEKLEDYATEVTRVLVWMDLNESLVFAAVQELVQNDSCDALLTWNESQTDIPPGFKEVVLERSDHTEVPASELHSEVRVRTTAGYSVQELSPIFEQTYKSRFVALYHADEDDGQCEGGGTSQERDDGEEKVWMLRFCVSDVNFLQDLRNEVLLDTSTKPEVKHSGDEELDLVGRTRGGTAYPPPGRSDSSEYQPIDPENPSEPGDRIKQRGDRACCCL
jgi:hypothetical protein